MNRPMMALIVCTAFLLFPAALQAQGHGRPKGDRARTFLVVRISEALDLSDEQALQISRILREAGERRRNLRKEREDIEHRIRSALGSGDSDESQLKNLVSRANEVDEKLALISERSMREAQKLLSNEEQAKLVLFRPELAGEIREVVRHRAQDEWQRPRRPLPPRD